MKFLKLIITTLVLLVSFNSIKADSTAVAAVGKKVTISVSVQSGTTPFTYQWRKNGTAISGATVNPFVINSVTTVDAGDYTVNVTNVAGSILSDKAVLTIATLPSLSSLVNVTVDVGASASFSVVASGTGPFTYQWYKNAVAISGATSATYTDAAVATSDAGNYYVVVTSPYGSATSNTATLTVNTYPPVLSPVTITVQ